MIEEPTAGGESQSTGDPTVDSVLGRLVALSECPPEEQVRGYDEVHRRLADAMADLPER